MLNDGDRLQVAQDESFWEVHVEQSDRCWQIAQAPLYVSLPGKKPYLINLSQVECMVGEWNKDKTQYGIRIFYTSGNSVWVGENAAKEMFDCIKITGKNVEDVFNHAKSEG